MGAPLLRGFDGFPASLAQPLISFPKVAMGIQQQTFKDYYALFIFMSLYEHDAG